MFCKKSKYGKSLNLSSFRYHFTVIICLGGLFDLYSKTLKETIHACMYPDTKIAKMIAAPARFRQNTHGHDMAIAVLIVKDL